MLIAVDYDDTILQNGSVSKDMIDYLIESQRLGAKIVLWTVRVGERRDEAVELCKKYGLVFDGVAEGKPLADMYIDDKAVRPSEVVRPTTVVKKGITRQSITRQSITRQRLTSLQEQRRR